MRGVAQPRIIRRRKPSSLPAARPATSTPGRTVIDYPLDDGSGQRPKLPDHLSLAVITTQSELDQALQAGVLPVIRSESKLSLNQPTFAVIEEGAVEVSNGGCVFVQFSAEVTVREKSYAVLCDQSRAQLYEGVVWAKDASRITIVGVGSRCYAEDQSAISSSPHIDGKPGRGSNGQVVLRGEAKLDGSSWPAHLLVQANERSEVICAGKSHVVAHDQATVVIGRIVSSPMARKANHWSSTDVRVTAHDQALVHCEAPFDFVVAHGDVAVSGSKAAEGVVELHDRALIKKLTSPELRVVRHAMADGSHRTAVGKISRKAKVTLR